MNKNKSEQVDLHVIVYVDTCSFDNQGKDIQLK